MAYVFKQEASIAHNINRILNHEVRAALGALDPQGPPTPETIHGVRKRIKKIRALLRIVRSEIKPKVFRRLNHHYRTTGQQLSALRDAAVMIKTLEKLRAAQPTRLPDEVFTALHQALVAQQGQTTRQFVDDPSSLGRVTKALAQAAKQVISLTKGRKGFDRLKPNLKAGYRRASKALATALDQPGIDEWHELRKEVKTLWYHTRLLQPSWPHLWQAYARELGRLSELLGDDHDLGVLSLTIEADRLWLDDNQIKEAVLQELRQQRLNLQAQIYPLANRLLAEKAGAFVNRFELAWQVWKAEVKQPPINQLRAA